MNPVKGVVFLIGVVAIAMLSLASGAFRSNASAPGQEITTPALEQEIAILKGIWRNRQGSFSYSRDVRIGLSELLLGIMDRIQWKRMVLLDEPNMADMNTLAMDLLGDSNDEPGSRSVSQGDDLDERTEVMHFILDVTPNADHRMWGIPKIEANTRNGVLCMFLAERKWKEGDLPGVSVMCGRASEGSVYSFGDRNRAARVQKALVKMGVDGNVIRRFVPTIISWGPREFSALLRHVAILDTLPCAERVRGIEEEERVKFCGREYLSLCALDGGPATGVFANIIHSHMLALRHEELDSNPGKDTGEEGGILKDEREFLKWESDQLGDFVRGVSEKDAEGFLKSPLGWRTAALARWQVNTGHRVGSQRWREYWAKAVLVNNAVSGKRPGSGWPEEKQSGGKERP